MAIINQLQNTASVNYNGTTVNSNTVTTILALPPALLKSVDKAVANVGDTLTYTVTITNVSLTALTNLPFSDTLPTGSVYVSDTFKVNGAAAAAKVDNNALTYTIPSIAAGATATVTFQCKVLGALS